MLVSGLPKQTVEQWEHTLSEAVSTGAAHISVYDLQVGYRMGHQDNVIAPLCSAGVRETAARPNARMHILR